MKRKLLDFFERFLSIEWWMKICAISTGIAIILHLIYSVTEDACVEQLTKYFFMPIWIMTVFIMFIAIPYVYLSNLIDWLKKRRGQK